MHTERVCTGLSVTPHSFRSCISHLQNQNYCLKEILHVRFGRCRTRFRAKAAAADYHPLSNDFGPENIYESTPESSGLQKMDISGLRKWKISPKESFYGFVTSRSGLNYSF